MYCKGGNGRNIIILGESESGGPSRYDQGYWVEMIRAPCGWWDTPFHVHLCLFLYWIYAQPGPSPSPYIYVFSSLHAFPFLNYPTNSTFPFQNPFFLLFISTHFFIHFHRLEGYTCIRLRYSI